MDRDVRVDSDEARDDEIHEDSPVPRADARPRERPDAKPDTGRTPADKQRGGDDENDSGDKGEDGKKDDGKKPSTRWPLIILAIVVVLAAIGGGVWWFLHRDQTNTDDAYTDGRAVMIAPQVNGYVTQLAVNDNQFVHKGRPARADRPAPLCGFTRPGPRAARSGAGAARQRPSRAGKGAHELPGPARPGARPACPSAGRAHQRPVRLPPPARHRSRGDLAAEHRPVHR